jgi:antitoxin (DNA-binding transcriptional repressor) of toxin-antitoxin stability system
MRLTARQKNKRNGLKQVGVRELRQNLSVHLRRVLRGETLEVTDRGRAVAILAPLPKETSVLERLRAEGRILIPAQGDLLALKRPSIRPPRPTSDMLDEQRADRDL